jgi:hypothetical protein
MQEAFEQVSDGPKSTHRRRGMHLFSVAGEGKDPRWLKKTRF